MSLKQDFYDGSTGFNQWMQDIFDAGESWIINLNTTLSADLKSEAAKGNKTFNLRYIVSFETENLRLEGTHLYTFFAGIQSALANEGIYEYECSPTLDTSDQLETYIILNFTF